MENPPAQTTVPTKDGGQKFHQTAKRAIRGQIQVALGGYVKGNIKRPGMLSKALKKLEIALDNSQDTEDILKCWKAIESLLPYVVEREAQNPDNPQNNGKQGDQTLIPQNVYVLLDGALADRKKQLILNNLNYQIQSVQSEISQVSSNIQQAKQDSQPG